MDEFDMMSDHIDEILRDDSHLGEQTEECVQGLKDMLSSIVSVYEHNPEAQEVIVASLEKLISGIRRDMSVVYEIEMTMVGLN